MTLNSTYVPWDIVDVQYVDWDKTWDLHARRRQVDGQLSQAKRARSCKKRSRIFKSLEKAALTQLPPSPQQQGDDCI